MLDTKIYNSKAKTPALEGKKPFRLSKGRLHTKKMHLIKYNDTRYKNTMIYSKDGINR
jgi:hypothetical protein